MWLFLGDLLSTVCCSSRFNTSSVASDFLPFYCCGDTAFEEYALTFEYLKYSNKEI
jgi:hypothetical protein